MAGRIRIFLRTIVFAAVVVSATAYAEPQILYSESIQLSTAAPDGTGLRKIAPAQRTSFRAFGRSFDLILEDNSRLVGSFAPQRAAEIARLQLLRGSLEGSPDSWVRLSVDGGSYEGAIWDGSELYVIDSAARIRRALKLVQPAASNATIIFRLSDVPDLLPANYCGVGMSTRSSAGALGSYKNLVRELKASVALLASREIEVSMVADSDFGEQYPGFTAMSEMIRRVNIVDGIFDSQLNINLIPTDFNVVPASGDPFDTNDSEMLLGEVSRYRSETPLVQSRGLTHLLTGRHMDDGVLGIAYLDSLCEVPYGVSLSQDEGAVIKSALIMAHEIGHNLGADHDNEAGSACAGTAPTFLMAPYYNESTLFSQCSVSSIQAAITGKTCLLSAKTRDIAVSMPVTEVGVVIDEPFEYAVDVASTGQGDAHNITVSAGFSSFIQVLSVSMPGANCVMSQQSAQCQMTQLAAGSSTRLTVTAISHLLGTQESRVFATASSERDTTNNTLSLPIVTSATADASVTMDPARPTAEVHAPFDVVATIRGTGSQALTNVVARVRFLHIDPTSVTSDAGSCTMSLPDGSEWSCPLGTLAPAQVRHVQMRVAANTAEYEAHGGVELSHDNGSQGPTRSAGFTVNVLSRYDISIDPLPFQQIAAIGQTVNLPVVVRSKGTQAVPDVHMRIYADARMSKSFTAPGATCAPAADYVDCSFGTLAAGATVNGQLQLSANEELHYSNVTLWISPDTLDDYRTNNSTSVSVDVRPGSDVGVEPPRSQSITFYDRQPVQVYFQMRSNGAQPPQAVTANLSLPDSFSVQSASIQNGTCSTTAHTVACTVPTIPQTGSFVEVHLTAAEPGTYQGTFTVGAANDSVPANNSRPYTFNIVPYVDAGLALTSTPVVVVEDPVTLTYSLTNGRYSMADSKVTFFMPAPNVLEAVSASQGSCVRTTSTTFECSLGTLAPSSITTFTVQARWTAQGGSMGARFSSPYDLYYGNNEANGGISVYERADVAVQLEQDTMNVADGEGIYLSATISSNGRAAPFIEFDADPTRISHPSVIQGAFGCNWTSHPARCEIPLLEAGSALKVVVGFAVHGVGTFPLVVRTGAINDRNPDNNSQTATITIREATSSPPPPPAPTPNPPAAKKGGGGGSIDPAFLLLILVLLTVARRRAGTPASAGSRSRC